MKEFFGLKQYTDGEFEYIRPAEGAWSWQHLTFVSLLMLTMVFLAVFLARKNKDKSSRQKNKILIACAFLIDGFEIIKIIVLCIRCQNPWHWLYVLPLFLCSVQLIAIPLAAFGRGRVQEASLDFVLIFGILGAIFGTIGAAQNYNSYPVLSMDNVFSGITHAISGFASIYIVLSGMASMKKKNFLLTNTILLIVSLVAYIANRLLDYNYMFLMHHDGTPYSIVYQLTNGNPVLYPLMVVGLFVAYTAAFYGVYYAIQNRASRRVKATQNAHSTS